MPPEDSEQARWFCTNIFPHEAALKAWLCKRYASVNEVDDIIQDTYVRVLETQKSKGVRAPKALLFRVARNLMLDHLKSHKVSRKIPYEEVKASIVIDTMPSVPEIVSRNQEIEILRAAIQSLPNQCRQVITLHEVYGMPQKEIAEKLGVTASLVSNQVSIGLRKCMAFMKKYKKEGE